jgi:hypothetical protein
VKLFSEVEGMLSLGYRKFGLDCGILFVFERLLALSPLSQGFSWSANLLESIPANCRTGGLDARY